MFDIGFGELLLLAVVALVVLGPERLPGAARTVGTLLRKLREGWASVREEVEREVEAEELKRNLQDVQKHMRDAGDSVRESVHKSTEEMREAADAMTGKPLDEADDPESPESHARSDPDAPDDRAKDEHERRD